MKNKIYWKEIPSKAKVIDEGSFYSYEGRFIYWLGNEASEAQTFLKRLARKS
ncbi:MAG: hypothetical protein M0R32_11490 [Candidatus Cloacimonetes bacterium]|jgi:hypothetical protein|nr:hypothetical protein [Candidatus Cloacimonadota bacterium]